MILLLGFAFLAGFVTILAPCIWPLLPIVLSSSAAGKSHTRPLGITLGIMLSFTFFILAISFLVSMFHLDANIVRLFAVLVLVFMGLSMIIPALSRMTELWVSRLSGKFGRTGQSQGSDFGSGFVTGLSLGIVWTPCSGPIFASIATLAATGQVTLNVVLVTLAYVIGVGIPLFILALGGQRVIGKTRFMSAYTGRVQQVFGVLMLLTALAIYTNYDKVLQLKLLNAFPSYSQALTSFEKNSAVKKQLDILKGKKPSLDSNIVSTSDLFNSNQPAPEFVGITKWLNSPRFGEAGTDQPLMIKELKGKVVLVDFWTYTCINCIRTLPHVTSWYEKYKDQGFIVVGVHTPEFEFEKDTNNVLAAIKQYNIHYPVPQDNNFATWNAYNNQYWPAEYLIDAKGIIRRTHFGEGKYDETEQAIQELLKEAGQQVNSKLENMPDQTPKGRLTPETYLGKTRMDRFSSNEKINGGLQNFTLSENLSEDHFAYRGSWDVEAEFAKAQAGSELFFNFNATKVYLVMQPGQTSGKVKVYLDDKSVLEVTVDSDRLYSLIDLKEKGRHLLRLEFSGGTKVYAFTFG